MAAGINTSKSIAKARFSLKQSLILPHGTSSQAAKISSMESAEIGTRRKNGRGRGSSATALRAATGLRRMFRAVTSTSPAKPPGSVLESVLNLRGQVMSTTSMTVENSTVRQLG